MDVWFCRAQEPNAERHTVRTEYPGNLDRHALASVPRTTAPHLTDDLHARHSSCVHKVGVSYGIGRTLSALAICQLEEYQIETAPLAIFANFLQT
jgi:hypothetical protein